MLGLSWLLTAGSAVRLRYCLPTRVSGQLIQGNLNGRHSGPQAPVDFHIAEPGDIILCHDPHGTYGCWIHAVLYIGYDQVVDANDFARGTLLRSANNYRDYD
ncbi:hypothetical protein [Alicyclobacillus dauci]|uniref:NlpC/P60 family protein n=1 Tax=Alicyclobacillus dauci TaxID=1475485 RepID=A0ABY6Z3S8_9BACL|nr:hypothetical protein [Alicyclobacillus dauci]WAH37501.1 hypothetical protein NZD86_02900 [Alicyclobacillus dauci]